MWSKKNFLFLLVYTLLFSALIFVGRSIFFPDVNYEEQYIEPSLEIEAEYQSFSGMTQEDIRSTVHDLIYEEFTKKYTQEEQAKVSFTYFPSELFEKIQHSYLPLAETFLYHKDVLSRIENLSILLYKNKSETRWRMKAKSIHLHGVLNMSDAEFLWVLIHEFGHYIDIYSLPKSTFWDESQQFYDISWDSVTTIRPDLKGKDFVSGYAMTNQYEDFAESYVYYVLHNKDFLEKSKESNILARKYTFFQKYIFPRNLFYKENFSDEAVFKSYYWDITKLPVDIKKFLQYLQSGI